ncbi:hypothetical protein EDB83DRAFT_2362517 [Lactarius deliciosus]|nr:hypothetical protein EDB83DRAFT_2362517 [Lactarius deliciosus]
MKKIGPYPFLFLAGRSGATLAASLLTKLRLRVMILMNGVLYNGTKKSQYYRSQNSIVVSVPANNLKERYGVALRPSVQTSTTVRHITRCLSEMLMKLTSASCPRSPRLPCIWPPPLHWPLAPRLLAALQVQTNSVLGGSLVSLSSIFPCTLQILYSK